MGEEASGQKDRFARHRHAGVLKQDPQEDDRIAVLGQQGPEPFRHSGHPLELWPGPMVVSLPPRSVQPLANNTSQFE
jgi:hypothetical protein